MEKSTAQKQQIATIMKSFPFKYELQLFIFLMLLFKMDWFIRFVLFQIIGMDYESVSANVITIILHATVFFVAIGVALHDQKKSIVEVCYFKKTSSAVWGAAVVCIIGFVFLYFYLIGLFYTIYYNSNISEIGVILLHTPVFFVIIGIALYNQKKSKRTHSAVLGTIILCSIVFVVLFILVCYLNDLFFRILTGWGGFYSSGDELKNIPLELIDHALIPAVAEELLFKGVVFTGLKKRYSQRTAIIISALLFSAVHLSPVRIIPLFLSSLCTFWLYLRTGSILLPIIEHFMNNLFATVLIREPFHSPETFLVSQIIFWIGFYLLNRATAPDTTS